MSSEKTQWENKADLQVAVRQILAGIGEDPDRDGLVETPERVVKAWAELYSGYKADPREVFKEFDSEKYDGLVKLVGCEFVSTCEHHMLSFFGAATIAYLPNTKIIGASKLARLLEIFSRRLQNQERLTKQIVDAILAHTDSRGAACFIEAKHLCMVARGVGKANCRMQTSYLGGAFRHDAALRAEFFSLTQR